MESNTHLLNPIRNFCLNTLHTQWFRGSRSGSKCLHYFQLMHAIILHCSISRIRLINESCVHQSWRKIAVYNKVRNRIFKSVLSCLLIDTLIIYTFVLAAFIVCHFRNQIQFKRNQWQICRIFYIILLKPNTRSAANILYWNILSVSHWIFWENNFVRILNYIEFVILLLKIQYEESKIMFAIFGSFSTSSKCTGPHVECFERRL